MAWCTLNLVLEESAQRSYVIPKARSSHLSLQIVAALLLMSVIDPDRGKMTPSDNLPGGERYPHRSPEQHNESSEDVINTEWLQIGVKSFRNTVKASDDLSALRTVICIEEPKKVLFFMYGWKREDSRAEMYKYFYSSISTYRGCFFEIFFRKLSHLDFKIKSRFYLFQTWLDDYWVIS